MEVSSKLINSANASIDAKFDAKSIENKVNEIAAKTAKQVKIDGFRPGKVPVNVVKKRYEKALLDDAKQELFKKAIDDGLKSLDKKQSDLLGEPVFAKFEEVDGGIDAIIEISFKPEIDIKGYEKLIPKYEIPEASKDEVKTKIDELLLMVAPLEKADKDSLEKGDFAKFDFEGFLDAKPFEGGSAKDYSLEIGSNQFIPGFEDAMIGLKPGEEKDINLTFPSDYNAKNLAGKDVVFKVKLHEIQAKNPAKKLDKKTLTELTGDEKLTIKAFEERIENQIKHDKFNKILNEELKPKFVDDMTEKFDFDLPKTIVEQEIDLQFRNSWNSFTKEDMEKFRTDKDALTNKREEFRKEAEKSVKLTFIIDELAKDRKVEVSDQELVQAIYFEAYQNGIDPKKHLETYQKQGILPAVKMALIEEKLFNDLFKLPESKDEKADDKEDKKEEKPAKKTTKKATKEEGK